MTKAEALARVAQHVAGLLQGGTFEESTGVMPGEKLSSGDEERLAEAVEELVARLYRMGSGGRS
jgi:hypothetical protein